MPQAGFLLGPCRKPRHGAERDLPVVEDERLLGVVSMIDVTGIFAVLAPGSVSVSLACPGDQ
jgi:hypothetical protein